MRTAAFGRSFFQLDTFTYGTGAPATAARYTYVYKYEGGGWLIAQHHSSVRPEPKP
jgi:hypothetical protein